MRLALRMRHQFDALRVLEKARADKFLEEDDERLRHRASRIHTGPC